MNDIPVRHVHERRLMTRREVCARIGASYKVIYLKMQKGEFPRAHMITPTRVGWFSDEIEKWINDRPIQPIRGDVGTDDDPMRVRTRKAIKARYDKKQAKARAKTKAKAVKAEARAGV